MHFYYNSDEQLMQRHGTAYILLLHIILIEKEETQLMRNVKEEKTSNKTLNLDNSSGEWYEKQESYLRECW